MRCNKCGNSVPEDSGFCQFCGEKIEAEPTKTCGKCGNIVPDDSSFCPFCGEKIEPEPANKKCEYCGLVLPEDSSFCQFCGHAVDAASPTAAAVAKPQPSKKAKPRRFKKVLFRILIVIVALAALAALVVFCGIPGVKYLSAKKLLSEGEYDRAYSAFSELGSFANSSEMMSETKYLQAKEYRASGNFTEANKIFKALGNYKDSNSLIHYHDYKVSKSIPATCTTAGEDLYRCDGCGNERTETIKATDHHYENRVTKEATCTAQGERLYYCTNCNKQYAVSIPVKNHTYKQTSVKDATCTKTGEKIFTCSDCGKTYTEVINKKAHSYSNATCTAARTCKTCGKTDGSPLGHTNNAVCTRCGKVMSNAKSDIFNYLCYILLEHSNTTFSGSPAYHWAYSDKSSWVMFYDFDTETIVISYQSIFPSSVEYGHLWISESLAPYRFTYASYSSIYASERDAWGWCYIDPQTFSLNAPLSFISYEGPNQYNDQYNAGSLLTTMLTGLGDLLTTEFADGYSIKDLGFDLSK